MEDLLILSGCHLYDGPDFIPEPENYSCARDRDAASGTKKHRFEAMKHCKKMQAIRRKEEKDSFIPEDKGYYKPVRWSPDELKSLKDLRSDPGGASNGTHVHNGRGGISMVQYMYGGRFDQ